MVLLSADRAEQQRGPCHEATGLKYERADDKEVSSKRLIGRGKQAAALSWLAGDHVEVDYCWSCSNGPKLQVVMNSEELIQPHQELHRKKGNEGKHWSLGAQTHWTRSKESQQLRLLWGRPCSAVSLH